MSELNTGLLVLVKTTEVAATSLPMGTSSMPNTVPLMPPTTLEKLQLKVFAPAGWASRLRLISTALPKNLLLSGVASFMIAPLSIDKHCFSLSVNTDYIKKGIKKLLLRMDRKVNCCWFQLSVWQMSIYFSLPPNLPSAHAIPSVAIWMLSQQGVHDKYCATASVVQNNCAVDGGNLRNVGPTGRGLSEIGWARFLGPLPFCAQNRKADYAPIWRCIL
jgi:hypothetical protein